MVFNHVRFGNDILACRLQLGLTTTTIATIADTSTSVISRYERAQEPNLHVSMLLKICNVFDLDVREYFELER